MPRDERAVGYLRADELRSLLGERLDKIQSLATKVIAATKGPKDAEPSSNETPIPFRPNDK